MKLLSFSLTGTLFDNDSLQAFTAFRYEIERHNNQSRTPFKFDRYEKTTDVSNSYELVKSSEYNMLGTEI